MPSRQEKCSYRFEEKFKILAKVPVINVMKIQFHPLFEGNVMPLWDNLPGTGNARPH